MDHDFIIITPHGQIINKAGASYVPPSAFRQAFMQLNQQKLKVSTIFMSEQDYEDLLEWSKQDGT